MSIQTLISPQRTLNKVAGSSKKRVLELLANAIAQDVPGVDADDVFRRLIARERLGATGIGYGVAIPHCRAEFCQHTTGALLTLAEPIDFDAIDSQPVDILFAMLVPEEAQDEHLQTLAALAAALGQEEFRAALRSADSDQALYDAVSGK